MNAPAGGDERPGLRDSAGAVDQIGVCSGDLAKLGGSGPDGFCLPSPVGV